MSIATDFPTDSALQTRRVWLAPICLCLVAGLHCLRVTTAGQTPWKGGGFGMFSTIDSEHSRFVHAYLLSKDGPLPLQIPSELDKKVAELRAAPHQALAKELAAKLAERSWIDPQALQQALLGIRVYGDTDRPWMLPANSGIEWNFSSPELAMNILLPDPDQRGLWDWRSPFYLAVDAESQRPLVQPHVIDFLKKTAWVDFIIAYHLHEPFRGLRPALIPAYTRFNPQHNVP